MNALVPPPSLASSLAPPRSRTATAAAASPLFEVAVAEACSWAGLLIGMFTTGWTSVVAFISVGLFCSTMWPCIFALAITGLGNKTNQGSSLLIMMIMGGGFIGYMLGTTANAMAVMRTLVERYGASPRAFLVAPLVGAFFIDFTNALIITGYINYFK